MIPISKAIRIIERESSAIASERIDLSDAIGRVLAENIIADSDLPPFDRSQMDGYAVRADDTKKTPATLRIAGESAAGRGWHKTLKKGEAVRIMTGAPVPKGADAVQKIELTSEKNGSVTIFEPTEKGRFIVRKGAEIRKGRTVLKKGEVLTPPTMAVPAAFGYAKVKVAKRPRVAIFSTGSEIVDISKTPKKDQIRNSNSLMLAALCRAAGAEPELFPTTGDDISDLKSQISKSIKRADILITTGGVSVGKYDLTKLALQELGAKIFFDKVALKPGKPTVFGKLKNTFVFGLPGNPVSAAVTFHLFVRLLIGRLQGRANPCLKDGTAVAGAQAKGTKARDSYLPASLSTDANGCLIATPLRWLGSSDFVGFATADALVFVPAGETIEKGETATVAFLF
ncbi:MAG: gephyrin-like molybdotransferase Glp [Pyrinomonadaceae bacterium]